MVLPIIKLVILLGRQITRPVVHRFSVLAKRNQTFRSVIVPIGQGYHSMDFTSQSKLFGFETPTRVEPLSTDEAMNLGTKLLGEVLVYGVSASFLLYEYHKSSPKEKIKEENRQNEKIELQGKIQEYWEITETEIENLRSKIFELEAKNRH
ncbi:putative OPA3-like protein CG43998 [Mytilus californianus]|uniref:putative OPA3-like protein CG43998 n=1 Tax=Mytilus californianus TaxID=6549 RepID=UPI002247A9E1|nr:putative OPA3-like protein CG43998 [Mytilus californianus]